MIPHNNNIHVAYTQVCGWVRVGVCILCEKYMYLHHILTVAGTPSSCLAP